MTTRLFRSLCLTPLAALCLAAAPWTAQTTAPTTAPTTKPVDTVFAERYYECDAIPSVETFEAMVSRAASQHADIIGVAPSKAGEAIVTQVSLPDIVLRIDLTVIAGDIKPHADEFLDKVTETLQNDLRETQASKLRLAESSKKLEQASAEHEKAYVELVGLREFIRKAADRADLTIGKYDKLVEQLEQERQALKLKLTGTEARQKIQAETVAKLTESAIKRSETDAIAAELQKVVEAREQAYDRIQKMFQSGNAAGVTDVENAKAAVAETRARLLERRETVVQSAGGNVLANLNQELATLSADLAEELARLHFIQDNLTKLRSVREPLEQAAEVDRRVQTAAQRRQEAEQLLRSRREMSSQSSLRLITSRSIRADDPGIKDENGNYRQKNGQGLFGGSGGH